ncbi:hypothetical protein [Streptomyces fragilis]|uniref:Integral membrane protein n=1 Tax=Streptomyces fragilis TaxID=67301 RepID=A0ABV2YKT6_9ACTN|nr:hypothetical protein [Streptomyces fragilis]
MAHRGRNYAWMLVMSMLVLGCEVMLGLVAGLVALATTESPGVVPGTLTLVFLPLLAVAGVLFGLLFSHVVVMPVVWLGDGLARLFRRPRAWWWVLPAAVLVALPASFLFVRRTDLTPTAAMPALWAAVVAFSLPPALLARLRGTGRSWRPVGRVALWGAGTVVGAGVLGALALATGVVDAYQPPSMTARALAGSWANGDPEVLVLHADGTATATGLSQFEDDGTRADPCDGRGAWTFDPGDDAWAQRVTVRVPGCVTREWEVGGSEDRPVLYVYVGDPDSAAVYELTRSER